MKPFLALIAAVAVAAALAGCGQPGPLYMPKPPAAKPAPATTPATPAQAAPGATPPVSSSPAPSQQ